MPISTPNPKQALALFCLVFTDQEPMVSELKPRLSPKEREPLEKAGLIEIDRRGRANHMVLTEAAWDWAGKNLDVPISDTARANETLVAVLRRLKAFLDSRGIALGEMVREGRSRAGEATSVREKPASKKPASKKAASKKADSKKADSKKADSKKADSKKADSKKADSKKAASKKAASDKKTNGTKSLAALVRAACLHAASGRTHVRVRLTDVRNALSDVPRASLDEALLEMLQSGVAVFFRLDDPQERLSADERDALNIAGTPHHVLYLNG
jgi:hypothetical protein